MEPKIYSNLFNILDYGAATGGELFCTDAFNKAADACFAAGGGTVYVPSGVFLTGAILLKSNTNLYLESGAVVRFSDDPGEYPLVNSRWEGVGRQVYMPCIYAENAENIIVGGFGVLDGNGSFWWSALLNNRLKYPRPKLISFHGCKNVRINNIKLINSPSWTINPICCEGVFVDSVYIKNPANSPNTDGINPDSCKNVHISNCHIDVGDDCIAVKSGTEENPERIPCENITIANCTMIHGHGGVVLGSEMSGSIRNVAINNCIFVNTDRGIRMKSRRGRGGTVEDVTVNNIIMKNVMCPFTVNLYYFCGPKGDEKYVWDKTGYLVTDGTPSFKRLRYSNISAINVRACAGFFYGLPEMYIDDVSFDNINIEMSKEIEPGMPDLLANQEPLSQKGFLACNVSDFSFRNVTVKGADGPAFKVENATSIEFSGCKAKNSIDGSELVKTVNVI